MDEEIKRILENHEKRIRTLEEAILPKGKTKEITKNYKGLAGGIRFLIENGFLNEPKTVNEIRDELKREGYHHGIAPISKMLSVNFTNKRKVLKRFRDEGTWKYIVRE